MDHESKLLAAAAAATLRCIEVDQQRAPARIKPLLGYLQDHLFESEIDYQHLAQTFRIRDHTLPTQFHAAIGMPPYAYIQHGRLETAYRLLRDTELSIWRVATLVGYQPNQTFSRAFRRWYGENPRELRRKLRSGEPVVPIPARATRQTGVATLARSGQAERTVESGSVVVLEPFCSLRDLVARGHARVTALDDLWSRLQDLSFEDQRQLVRFRLVASSPALFDFLRSRSHEASQRDRQRGVELARLALESVDSLDRNQMDGRCFAHLQARGWAWLGHTLQMAGDFPDAEQAFAMAYHLLPSDPEAVVEGELLGLESGLRQAQRRFDEALSLINRSLARYRSVAAVGNIGKALIERAVMRDGAGHRVDAIADLEEALRLLAGGPSAFLELAACHRLVWCYTKAGHHADAAALLSRARTLCSNLADPSATLQIKWLEAHVAQAAGRPRAAVTLFETARAGFLRLGQHENVVALSLDLATLYAHAGRPTEVIRHAARVVPLFDGLASKEAGGAARDLLQDALDKNDVTLAVLQAVRNALESRNGHHAALQQF